MKRKTATYLAFLVAPIVPTVIGAIAMIPQRNGFGIVTLLGFAVLSYFFSGVFTLMLGMPLFSWLLRINMVRWWTALISGFVIGATVALIVRLPTIASSREFILLGCEGAVSAGVFWLIWRCGETASSK